MSLDINLTNVQSKPIVVSANQTAENDRVYNVIANATFTDPTGVNGKGYTIFVRNGTATIGGANFGVQGCVVIRMFHSGSWTNYFHQQSLLSTALDESVANKSINVNTDQASNSKYPSVKAVFDWATNLFFPKPTGTTAQYLRGDGTVATFPTIPDTSDFVAKSDFTAHSILAKQSGASDPVAVSIGNNEILGRKSGGGSNIEGLSVSEVKSLLGYTASDVGAVASNSVITGATKTKITYDAKGLVTAGADATIADLGFFRLDFTPSSVVTGTTSETQVGVIMIPANTIKTTDLIQIFTPLVKVGSSGTCTVLYKLSTSSTMPSGTTDRIATFVSAAANLWLPMQRNIPFSGANLVLPFLSTSFLSDFVVSNNVPTLVAINRTVDLYLYVSVQLSNAAERVYLAGGHVTNM